MLLENPHIMLKNFPHSTPKKAIFDLCRECGTPAFQIVILHKHKLEQRAFAWALISLSNPAQLDAAIRALDNQIIGGNRVTAEKFISDPEARRKLFEAKAAHERARVEQIKRRYESPRAQFRSEPHPTWQGSTWQPKETGAAR